MEGLTSNSGPEWALLDAAPDAMLVVDALGDIVFANRRAESLFGRSRVELCGASLARLLPERFRERHARHFESFFSSPRTRPMGAGLTLRGLRADGSEFPVDISLGPAEVAGRSVVIAAVRDVSARQAIEDELLRSREELATALQSMRETEQAPFQLASLLANIQETIVAIDAKGVIQFANRNSGLLGHEGKPLPGSYWLDQVPPDQRAAATSAFASVLATGVASTLEVAITAPAGSTHWFTANIAPIRRDQGNVGAVIVSREITRKKQLEAQLVASERMASMGTLAAGVAHEINNPLASVVGNLDLALQEAKALTDQFGLSNDLLAELGDARDGAERVRLIVRDLKLFSRIDDVATGAVELQRVLDSTLRLAWNEIRHRARLVKLYGEVPEVEGNASQLGQVFLNLLLNAAQSMPEGHVDANEIRVSTTAQGGSVLVEISDTGCGMTPEVQQRLFQPFFTTKPVGVGTGLGLAICSRIVKGLGGSIEVRSAVGVGTTFQVHLPVARTVTQLAPAPNLPPRVQMRRGRVLVVDDEPMIGTLLRRTLGVEHEVVTTTTAAEALARFALGERFDVIFCDLMMPNATGMEFYEELQRQVPDQSDRIVFLTGGVFTAQAREFLENVEHLQIEKPFDRAQVRKLVNDLVR